MSYDVSLLGDDGKAVTVERHEGEGGTYVLGGSATAELNTTYNYSFFYYNFLSEDEGLRWLNGKKAYDCIDRMERAVKVLHTNRWTQDYWAPTPGNAGYALNILLGWARQHPDAHFEVS